jgi:hypothetical protein
MKRYALDWLEVSIWGGSDFEEWLISWVKKNLFINLSLSAGNPHYFSSLSNKLFGFTLFQEVRPKCKNSPLFLRLTGQFFKLKSSHDFIDALLGVLNACEVDYNICRVDACVDFISTPGDQEFIPKPSYKEVLPGKRPPMDYTGDDVNGVKMWSSGKSDSRLRVYNKLLENPDYAKDYYAGKEDFLSVWRLEYQFRSKSLKKLQNNLEKVRCKFQTSEAIIKEILGQAGRRFDFEGFELKPSLITGYVRKQASDLGKINAAKQKALSNFRRYEQLSYIAYRQGIYEQSQNFDMLKIMDFERFSRSPDQNFESGVPF